MITRCEEDRECVALERGGQGNLLGFIEFKSLIGDKGGHPGGVAGVGGVEGSLWLDVREPSSKVTV